MDPLARTFLREAVPIEIGDARVVVERRGCVLALAGADERPAFLALATFSMSHRGHADRGALEATAAELRALDAWMRPRVAPAAGLNVLAHLLGAPEQTLEVLETPIAPRRGDLELREAYFPEVPLTRYFADIAAYKRAATTLWRSDFVAAPHVFVAGVARSGTRWVARIAEAILRAARVPRVTPVPALQEGNAVHAIAYLRGRGRRYLSPDEDGLLDAFDGDPIRRMQFACPPRGVLVAKIDRGLLPGLARLPHARVLLVTRDPRDVAMSQRAYFREEDRPVLATMASVVVELEAWLEAARTVGALHVRYEDLLRSPTSSIAALATSLGHPLPDAVVEAVARDVSFRAMAQGREYGQRVDGDYFRGGSSFRTELSAQEQASVHRVFGERLARLGYD